MPNHIEVLTQSDLEQIHKGTMQVMNEIGVAFPHQPAVDIFNHNGFRVDGEVVYFDESQLMSLLDNVPALSCMLATLNAVSRSEQAHLF